MKSGKYWRYDYSYLGKRKTLALGVYPDVGLKAVRGKHQQAREVLASGVDPSEHKQAVIAEQLAKAENSFESVAHKWHKQFSTTCSEEHAKQVLTRIERDLFPFISGKPIAELKARDILQCLRRIEKRGALSTAHRVRTDVGQICRYAVASGMADYDPTPSLQGALPPLKKKSLAAITDPQVAGNLLRDIMDYQGDFKTVKALQLAAYLYQRPGNIRHMKWEHINFESATWEIPAEQMKRREEHFVPLSRQALAILEEMRPLTGRFKYVFSHRYDIKKPMGKTTLTAAIHLMGVRRSNDGCTWLSFNGFHNAKGAAGL